MSRLIETLCVTYMNGKYTLALDNRLRAILVKCGIGNEISIQKNGDRYAAYCMLSCKGLEMPYPFLVYFNGTERDLVYQLAEYEFDSGKFAVDRISDLHSCDAEQLRVIAHIAEHIEHGFYNLLSALSGYYDSMYLIDRQDA